MLALILPLLKADYQSLRLVKPPSIEEILVADLKSGNPLAIKRLYKMYAPALNGIIKRIIKFDEVAEDILQDTFVKIWKSINQYDCSKGRLFTWMANVAKNLAIDQLRSKAHLNYSKTDDLGEIPIEIIDHKTYVLINLETIGIKQLLTRLNADEQEIINLIYFKGFTHVQAAEILNTPLGTIKTKLRLAILKLRKYFN
ncbi:sigma-70 family RNA polymerase sigma factor [Pedobacter polaris]|uniref:Sigma-70 family RNA polymerase sigma factor n=1 Tax=Pedobacter polaris TaxID=2571273 RepID=A0A4U1CPG8_9SPHI|nr:sigma-70 family RNA polymerase sigma factor [Pedobacter polaris]TKC09961.1 sigma-70 family RNA polymerase sigma factor [Pedobacter polaris]